MNLRFWMKVLQLGAVALLPSMVGAAPFVYVGGLDHLTVLDSATNAIVSTVPVDVTCPVGIAVNGNGTRVYVGCPFSFKVSVVDTGSNTDVASIPLGNGADGIAVNDAGTRVYAAIPSNDVVSVIDTATNTVVANVAVGANPDGLAVNPSGSRVYVANLHSNSVSVIDTANNTVVATIAVGSFPIAVAVNRAGTRAFVTNSQSNSVSVIDTATNTIVATVPVGSAPSGVAGPAGVAVAPDGTRLYVVDSYANNVSVIDTTTNAVMAAVAVGAGPLGVALNPAGTRAYVPSSDSNSVSVIDTASNAVIATVAGGIGCCVAFGQFIMPATAAGPAAAANYQGLWWNSPANSESGWGVNLAHQGDIIFASWFTYDTSGKGWWLVVTMNKSGANTYTGDLYTVAGARFDAFNPANVTATKAGTATLTFTDANNGSFNYVLGAINQTKNITREVFGTMPTCTFGTVADLTTATNYQDLWWNKPANSESGWGINLNHEGDTIFATWFTYDLDGTPLWLVVTANKTGAGVYSGDLYRTSGARYDAFNPASVVATKVGTATFTFADGNDATFDYTVQLAGMAAPIHQQKQITREIFTAPGTTCN